MNGVKWGNWHITINTNTGNQNTHQLVTQFTEAIEALVYDDIFEWVESRDGTRFTGADRHKILRVRAIAALEKNGTQNSSLHAHILVEIEHTTYIKLNYQKIKQIINRYCKTQCNVHIKYVHDKAGILKYIMKTVERPDAQTMGDRKTQAAFDSGIFASEQTYF